MSDQYGLPGEQGALSHLHPVAKEGERQRFYFFAQAKGSGISPSNGNSGEKKTLEDAIAWGIDYMKKEGRCTHVDVGVITTRVERESPPFRVTKLT